MPLTEEQRLRLEEIKRKAIEKRKQMQNQSFHGDSGSKPTKSNQNLTGNLESNNGKSFSSIQTEEQRLRMEENKRKAIEKRNQLQSKTFPIFNGGQSEKSQSVTEKSSVQNFYGSNDKKPNTSYQAQNSRCLSYVQSYES